MSYGLTDKKHYEDIAEAIRIKNGTTETYKPENMARAVMENGELFVSTMNKTITELQKSDLDGVTKLPLSGFCDCTKLKRVTLPNSVVNSEGGAFQRTILNRLFLHKYVWGFNGYLVDNTPLNTLVVDRTTPPAASNKSFLAVLQNNGGTVYVPFGTVDAYNASTNWSGYSEIIKPQAPIVVTDGVATKADDSSDCTCVVFPSNTVEVAEYAYDDASLVTSPPTFIYLNDGLKKIGQCAFNGSKITEIDIPSTVTDIGPWGFGYCMSLLDVYLYCSEPPSIDSTTFAGLAIKTTYFHVPYGSLEKYLSDTNWCEIAENQFIVEDRKI